MRYPWAVPGAKVVCVDASPLSSPKGFKWTGVIGVAEGKTYTIRSVRVSDKTGNVCVKLAECPDRSGKDRGYMVTRFRPLHTQETDVALFAHLLTPSPNSPMLPTKELTHQ